MNGYHDPWRRYETPPMDDPPPIKRKTVAGRFMAGLPWVVVFWIICGVIRILTTAPPS